MASGRRSGRGRARLLRSKELRAVAALLVVAYTWNGALNDHTSRALRGSRAVVRSLGPLGVEHLLRAVGLPAVPPVRTLATCGLDQLLPGPTTCGGSEDFSRGVLGRPRGLVVTASTQIVSEPPRRGHVRGTDPELSHRLSAAGASAWRGPWWIEVSFYIVLPLLARLFRGPGHGRSHAHWRGRQAVRDRDAGG